MTMDQTGATPEMPKKSGGSGGMMGVIVIVVLIVVGGIYYLMTTASPLLQNEAMPTLEDVQKSSDPDVQAAMTQGSSDAIADIEADLNATDLSGIDTEIQGLSQ